MPDDENLEAITRGEAVASFHACGGGPALRVVLLFFFQKSVLSLVVSSRVLLLVSPVSETERLLFRLRWGAVVVAHGSGPGVELVAARRGRKVANYFCMPVEGGEFPAGFSVVNRGRRSF